MAETGKRILITGSSGFIGGYVANEALAGGYDVLGFDIGEPKNASYKYMTGDIAERQDVHRAFEKGIDSVIHLAANSASVGMDYQSNVVGFCNIIEEAVLSGCKRFLYASSSAVYTSTFCENDTIDINALTNHYGKTKFIDELVAQSYAMEHPDMRIIGIRIFNAYGVGEAEKKNGKDSPVSRFITQRLSGKPMTIYGDGEQTVDLIAVGDVSNIILQLLEKAGSGVYNIGTGIPTTINQLADVIGGERVHVAPPSTNMVATSRLKCADTRKLFKTIGNYKFIPVAQGMKEVMEDVRKAQES